jgi:hypothetical protein
MRLINILFLLALTGCANTQQLAQNHWNWLSSNSGITPGYSTGVSITNYTVNGQSFQVVAPQR